MLNLKAIDLCILLVLAWQGRGHVGDALDAAQLQPERLHHGDEPTELHGLQPARPSAEVVALPRHDAAHAAWGERRQRHGAQGCGAGHRCHAGLRQGRVLRMGAERGGHTAGR